MKTESFVYGSELGTLELFILCLHAQLMFHQLVWILLGQIRSVFRQGQKVPKV